MKILVIYHSVTENTKLLAEAIAEGADMSDDIVTELKSVDEVRDDDFISADGIIAGSPVYFGSMSWQMKRMFDKMINIRRDMKDKIGAVFTTSGHHTGGKETTMMGIIQAMLICGMIIVGDPYESGGHFGIGTHGEPDSKGLEDGKQLGKRVAEVVRQLTK